MGRLHRGVDVGFRGGGGLGEGAAVVRVDDLDRIAGIAVLGAGDERPGVCRLDGAHAPTNSGLGFSVNALKPSLASLVRNSASISSPSSARPSSSVFWPPS